jgi:peptidoglycan/LPS O-acetylase OafA/YrhL
MKHIPELDGIRGCAIGMVLVHHFLYVHTPAVPGSILFRLLMPIRFGWMGVDLFFVLSGFLIGGILLDSRESANYFRTFYTRRFFRIVPIYAVFLALVFSIYGLAHFGFARRFAWMRGDIPLYSCIVFLQNFWMSSHSNLKYDELGITWSLAVEEQLYLTLPLLVRVLDRRRLLWVLGGGLFVAPLLRAAIMVRHPEYWAAAFTLMPCRADTLLLGVFGAIAVRNDTNLAWLRTHRKVLGGILAVLAFGFVLMDGFWEHALIKQFVVPVFGLTWCAMLFLALILYAVTDPGCWLSKCLRWRWLMWLGTIAYGTYLLNELILGLVWGARYSQIPGITSFAKLGYSLMALFITLVAAALSWTYFEKPLVQVGHRTRYE